MMDFKHRMFLAGHRVQTAIAYLMGTPGYTATEPKHLRVGIDLSKAEQFGLAALLISKGVFTMEEYVEAMAKADEEEADRLELALSEAYGRPVTTV